MPCAMVGPGPSRGRASPGCGCTYLPSSSVRGRWVSAVIPGSSSFSSNPDPPPSDYHALQAGHWRWGRVSLGGTHRRVYISRGGGHCSLSTPFSLWLPSQISSRRVWVGAKRALAQGQKRSSDESYRGPPMGLHERLRDQLEKRWRANEYLRY